MRIKVAECGNCKAPARETADLPEIVKGCIAVPSDIRCQCGYNRWFKIID